MIYFITTLFLVIVLSLIVILRAFKYLLEAKTSLAYTKSIRYVAREYKPITFKYSLMYTEDLLWDEEPIKIAQAKCKEMLFEQAGVMLMRDIMTSGCIETYESEGPDPYTKVLNLKLRVYKHDNT